MEYYYSILGILLLFALVSILIARKSVKEKKA